MFLNQKFRADRTYQDFLAYMEKHPETAYVEVDTVRCRWEQGKQMLTMLFTVQIFLLNIINSTRRGKLDGKTC